MFDDRILKRGFQLRAGLLRRRAWSQAPHNPQPPHPRPEHPGALRITIELWFHRQRECHALRRPDLPWAGKAWWRHADHRERAIIEIDLFAHDSRIAAEAFLPVAIAQHRDR